MFAENSFGRSHTHFQVLLNSDLEIEAVEQELRNELLKMLNSLAEQDAALTHIEKEVQKAKLDGSLLDIFDRWQFLAIDDPDKPGVRDALSELPNAEQILTLLDQVATKRQDIVLRKEALDETFLAAWRQKFPHFSSIGVIDSDIQSGTLKDAVKLARR